MIWLLYHFICVINGLSFPSDYRELCYNIMSTNKNIKIYAVNNLTFDYDNLKLVLEQGEAAKGQDAPLTAQTYYLKKTNGCQSDKLEFGKMGTDQNTRAHINISIFTTGIEPFLVDNFEFYLDHNHAVGNIELQGFNQIFAMEVAIVQTPTVITSTFKPPFSWSPTPAYVPGMLFFCLQFLKPDIGFMNEIWLERLSSNLEKYIAVVFNKRVENTNKEVQQQELAEFKRCNQRYDKPFKILIPDTLEEQIIKITIIDINDLDYTTAYKWNAADGASGQIDMSNKWTPHGFQIEATTAQNALSQSGPNSYVLFDTTKNEITCNAYEVLSYFTEYISQNVVLRTESKGFTPSTNVNGVLVGRIMTKEEIQKCTST